MQHSHSIPDQHRDAPSRKRKVTTHRSFNESIKRRPKGSEGDCFLCKFASSDHARESQKNIRQMLSMIKNGIKRKSLHNTASDVAKFYKSEIHEKSTNSGKELPIFTTTDVMNHIEFHIKSPSIVMAVEMEKIRDSISFVRDHIAKGDDDGNIEIDHKAVKSLVELYKELKSMYALPASNSFLNDKYLENSEK